MRVDALQFATALKFRDRLVVKMISRQTGEEAWEALGRIEHP